MNNNKVYPTKLVSQNIGSSSNASYHLGLNKIQNGYRICPLVLVPDRSCCVCCNFWVTIPNGFSAVAVSHGRFIGVQGPGFHQAGPQISITHLISKRYIVYDTPVKECPTQDNVMVEIDVALVIHILDNEESIMNFSYKLGPDKLDKLLKAFQEEAVREMARKRKYDQIYDLMDTRSDEQLANTMRTMNDNLSEYGVEVIHITITNVHLPQNLQKTMQEASTYDSLNNYKTIKQDFDLLQIDNEQFREKHAQCANEKLKELQSQFDKKIAEAQASLDETKAETEKIVAEISEKEKADVLEIESTQKLKVAEIESKKKLEMVQIEAKGEAESEAIKTEGRTYIRTLKGETEKKVSQNNVKALEYKVKAEQIASAGLKEKRDYNRKLDHLKALKEMALNDSICISGYNGDNILAQILSSRNSSNVLGLNIDAGSSNRQVVSQS